MVKLCEDLLRIKSVVRLYAAMSAKVSGAHGLSGCELDVLAFLHNHPAMNTARDIVENRMLPKSNVSQAVEALVRRGMLMRSPDTQDRRRLHLYPTAAAEAVVQDIVTMQMEFEKRLFAGITAQERKQYEMLAQRIANNAEGKL